MTSNVLLRSGTDTWETPQWLFNQLDNEFGFTLDVCALPATAKCDRYFTPDDDALIQNWGGDGAVCWMNPPYSRGLITPFMLKARAEAERGAQVVCLVAARTDTRWWWEVCTYGEIRFIRGRINFVGGKNGSTFPSAVVILHPYLQTQLTLWDDTFAQQSATQKRLIT